MIHHHLDTDNTLLATVVGATFSIVTHPMSDAFIYGFFGALGGLTCKLIYTFVIKKWFTGK